MIGKYGCAEVCVKLGEGGIALFLFECSKKILMDISDSIASAQADKDCHAPGGHHELFLNPGRGKACLALQ